MVRAKRRPGSSSGDKCIIVRGQGGGELFQKVVLSIECPFA
jgi:hypothetical protein